MAFPSLDSRFDRKRTEIPFAHIVHHARIGEPRRCQRLGQLLFRLSGKKRFTRDITC